MKELRSYRFGVRNSLRTSILASAIAICATTSFAADCPNASPRELANRDTVGIISGSVRGTYARFAQDMANVLDRECELRIVPILGKGSVQNFNDLLYLKGVDIAIVQSDVFSAIFERGYKGIKDISTKVSYITKLYNEEMHVLARGEIRNIRDLNGQTVSIGSPGSGTLDTSRIVFKQLDIPITPVAMTNADAVAAVRSGEIAAAVFVAGAPANYFSEIKLEEGLRFIKIEIDRELEEKGYLSSYLTSDHYPGVVPAGERVETIAVGAVLAVYSWKPTSSRYDRVKLFADRLESALPNLQNGDAYHAKWKEVRYGAQVPGWGKFGE